MLSWRGVALVQEARLGNSTVGPANRKSIFAAHTGAISLYGSIAHSRSDPRLAAGGTRLMADARRIRPTFSHNPPFQFWPCDSLSRSAESPLVRGRSPFLVGYLDVIRGVFRALRIDGRYLQQMVV